MHKQDHKQLEQIDAELENIKQGEDILKLRRAEKERARATLIQAQKPKVCGCGAELEKGDTQCLRCEKIQHDAQMESYEEQEEEE